MLKESDTAPDFTLMDPDGKSISLSGYKGKKIVLYFYPKDNTIGCTKEALSFRDEYNAILKTGSLLIGISPDGQSSHRRFRDKYNLPFILLSDETHSVAEAYGAWGIKKLYGKLYDGIIRSTFIIDEEGKIIKVFPKVTPQGHGAEVLKYLSLP